MKYPTGTSLALTCDTMNRVKTISLGGSSIVNSVSYHPSGQPRSVTYGNGKSTAWTYDDRGRAKTVTSAGVVELSYAYDGADNVTAFSNGAVTGSARTMTYDEQDRLETAIAKNLWGTAVYQYDELGNRTLASVGSSTTSYAYDASNRLSAATGAAPSTLKYDAVGGLLTGYGQTLTWDVAGRLSTASDGAVYRYDGDGARVEKVEAAQTTLYHHDLGGRVLAETLASGAALREYVYLGDKLVAVSGCVSGSAAGCTAERQWYHTDTLGSVLARTNASGTVVARLDYAPWGEQWTVPAAQGDRQYNGRVYDAGTGFHDYGARMYWPLPGRFISADSAQWDIANPASLNRYSYVLNNPYRYTDPTGHQEDPAERAGPPRAGAEEGVANREALAEQRLEGQGVRYDTVGPEGGTPSLESVQKTEDFADAVARSQTPVLLPSEAGPTGRISPFEVMNKYPAEIEARAKELGLTPKGPDPKGGKGAYVDPVTNQARIEVHPNAESPHGHVNSAGGARVGPDGNEVARKSPEAHLPIRTE